MRVKREVILKAIVTEKLKQELRDSLQAAIRQVEEQQEEMERQGRRMMLEVQRTDLNRAMVIRQQLENERRRQDEIRAALEEQVEKLESLALGEEIVRDTLEGEVEIAVGDDLEAVLRGAEIVIEDGIVKEIRDPASRGS